MKIQTKLLAAVFITIVLLVTIAATGIFSTASISKKMTELNDWSDIDRVMSEEVTQNYLLMDTLATTFRETPNNVNLTAFNNAYTATEKGLQRWTERISAQAELKTTAAQIKKHLVRYRTDMAQYAQLVTTKKLLKSDCDELMENLFLDLNVVLGIHIERGRAQARVHKDFDDMGRWNRIYATMNDEVIVNALKLQTALQDYFYSRTTPSYVLLTEQLATLARGMDQWHQTFTGIKDLEADGGAIFTYIDKLVTIFSAINANDKKTYGLADAMQKTIVELSTVVNGCMEDVIYPAQRAAVHHAQNIKKQAAWTLNGISAATILIALIAGIIFARSIAAPIVKTTAMIHDLVQGHTTQRLKLDGRKDEIGQMATNLDAYADNVENELIPALQAMARGDLTVSVHPVDDRDQLRHSMATLCRNLNALVVEVSAASTHINSVSEQVFDSSQSLSQGATATASSLEEISSSMQQMSAQLEQSAQNAAMANRLSGDTRLEMATGSQHMAAMVNAMSEINGAAQSIGNIIKVIDGIAFQTNLLALNAAVEAARAGQHGKGFAVVAEEVRNLAARSAKAAQETAALIEGSVTITNKGAQIARETEKALGDVVKSLAKVNDLVAEIATSTKEQAEGISQITVGLSQIDQVAQHNTATSEESTAVAQLLQGQAAHMEQLLSTFVLNEERQVHRVTETKGDAALAWQADQTDKNESAFPVLSLAS